MNSLTRGKFEAVLVYRPEDSVYFYVLVAVYRGAVDGPIFTTLN